MKFTIFSERPRVYGRALNSVKTALFHAELMDSANHSAMQDDSEKNLVFDVLTPLGFKVRVTASYWELIVTIKHPAMAGRETDVEQALLNPDEVRQSKNDDRVFLFYKAEREKRWVCAVTKRLNGDGFLITTYPADIIKEGVRVWPM